LLHIYDGREGALTDQELAELQRLERFAAIVASAERKQYEHTLKLQQASYEREIKIEVEAEREKVAHWMRSMGYATGHGDTVEDLLDHLGTQIAEGLLMEREACAKVCETLRPSRREFSKLFYDACTASADSIRARGNK
jgi:hypothetical protein